MMNNQHARLIELCAINSQDSLTAAQHKELQDLLRNDAEARRVWFAYQDMELSLRKMASVPNIANPDWYKNIFASTTDDDASRFTVQRSPKDLITRYSEFAQRFSIVTVIALVCLSAVVMFSIYSNRLPRGNEVVPGMIADNDFVRQISLSSPTDGSTFNFSEQPAKLVAFHFLLKSECPYCLQLTHDYSKIAQTTPDVLHVFVKPDQADEIRQWATQINKDGLQKSPVIYRDPDAALANQFSIPDGFQFHGQRMHYPALVLLDSSGRELFRYVGKDNSDRMPADKFVEKLASVTSHQQ